MRVCLFLLLAALLPGCQDDGETDGGRLPSGRLGVLLFNASGFEPFTPEAYTVKHWYQGFIGGFIHHPTDAEGRPEPAYLVWELQFADGHSDLHPSHFWADRPDTLRMRIRQRDAVPLGTRTLFTDDVEPPVFHLEVQPTHTQPVQRFEGVGRLDVFAADLKTGATWGRFEAELHPLDSSAGPYTIRAEFAANDRLICSWEVPNSPNAIHPDGYEAYSGSAPDGREDHCTPALAAIDAAEAHPDAPPVPPFEEVFYGTQRPLDRWPGLDRDL